MADSTYPSVPPEDNVAPAQPPTGAAPSRIEVLRRAALGPVNLQRYLQVFARFDAVGRRLPVWHLPAALCTLNWLVFRRLWREAAVYTLAMAALLGLCALFWQASAPWPLGVRVGVVGSLLLLGWLAPGWMAYALLHRQLQGRVLRVVSAVQTMDEAVRELQRQASSVQRLQLLVLVNAALVAALVLGLPRCCPGALESALSSVLPAAQRAPVVAQPTVATAWPAPPPVAQPSAVNAEATSSATTTATTPTTPTTAGTPTTASTASTASTATAAAVPTTGTVAAVAAVPTPTAPASTAVAAPAVSPASATPTAGANTPAGADGPVRFGINVGLFAQPENARRAFDRLQQAGLPATLEVVRTPQGERSRVRVGPFYARSAAQAAALRIQALGLEAVVFPP